MTELSREVAEALVAANKSRQKKLPGHMPPKVYKRLYFDGLIDIDGFVTEAGRRKLIEMGEKP